MYPLVETSTSAVQIDKITVTEPMPIGIVIDEKKSGSSDEGREMIVSKHTFMAM